MKSVTTKTYTTLLLALLAALWSTNAWAGIKIHVKVEGNTSAIPNIYAWYTPTNIISSAWPGDAMTETTTYDGITWRVAEFDESNFNILFNYGDKQSSDKIGINEDRYYAFNTNTGECYNLTNQYVIPGNATYVDGKQFVYYVNDKDWETPYAHVYNSSGNITGEWPGVAMTKVENSVNLWKWESTTSQTPANIIFNNNNQGSQSATLPYTNGGYYNSSYQITTITQLQLNAANFPDANFRAALAEALSVNEGDIIYPNNVKVLDVSGKGISDLTGIANFTNLEELYAQDNSLAKANFNLNTKLRILNVSNNSSLQGLNTNNTTGEATGNWIHIVNCPLLEEIYYHDCDVTYFGAIQYNTNLKKLVVYNNPKLEYFGQTARSALSQLEYLDMRNTGMTSSMGLKEMTALKYVDVSDNPTFNSYFTNLENLTQLKTFKAANCNLKASQTVYNSSTNYFPTESVEYVDLSGNTALTTMYCPATNNLKTLIVNGCTGLQGSSSAGALGGSSTYIPRMTHLEHLELNNVVLYLHTGAANGLFTLLTPTVAPNLHYIDLSNDNLGSAAKPTFAFPALDTLLINDNPALTELTVTSLNAPENLNINVTNDAALTTLAIINSGLTQNTIPTITATGATSLYKLDLTGNAFTDVPTTGIASLTTLVMNDNQLSDLNVSESNIQYLYAQNNNFGGGEYEMPETSLVGLDLGNNGFTKFKMTGNTTLKSLALSGNDALTEIELHGNTQLTQTSPDGVIESDNGLYIKGLSGLQTLNIENSSFNKLGQLNSLQGVTGLTKLQARNNKFTTFTNGVNPVGVTGTGSYRIADPTESSLEHLTALEYLDLAYNELCDSVHLYKNVALKHLDVSHNNHITGVYDGSITTEAQKTAMLEKKARHLMKYGNVYGVVGTNATAAQWEQGYTNFQKLRSRPFDLRTEDLNDTTGLYHLDLGQNVNLEWLDFSYTNIHNTASKPEMMNTGWINKDWVTDMGTFEAVSSVNTTSKRAYTSWHTYVYFIPCSKLKVIHADHNNMQSLGIRYFPELDTLTCSYMYGDCAYMRDFSSNSALSVGTNAISDEDVLIGMGNISLSTTVQKLKSVTWGTDKNGNPTSTLTWEGPDGAANTYYCNPIKYYDVSYSGFNEIRFYPGSYFTDLPNLEYVNVSGNPLNFQVKHYSGATLLDYSNVSNYNSLDLTYCPNIKTVLADNCSYLPTVRAYNRDALTTLDLTNDPLLKTVYAQDNAVLPSITGLSTLTGLETLFAYNNTQFGGIDVSNNTALKNLWVSRIGANSLDVSHNTGLLKLRAYDNSLSTLNVTGNTALTWLDVARNQIPSLDLSTNAALQYFNCSNSEETLDDQSLAANNHNGGEADEVKPVTSSHSASDTGNSLSDLVFNAYAHIVDVRANSNDLHDINGSFGNLTHIEFAHNHINGINLAAAEANNPTIVDEDNGRAITAECAKFIQHGTSDEVTLYYFQLANIRGQQLTGKTSTDSKDATRYLGEDGFELGKIAQWDGTNSAHFVPTTAGIMPRGITVDPSNMDSYLGGDVEGDIVVLKEDVQNPGEGRATYSYNNGVSESTFYLDWSSDGTVTGIDAIDVAQGLSVASSYGGMTIAGADGTVIGVYDMSGRQVASETISGGKATITGLTPGIYVVNGQKVVVK